MHCIPPPRSTARRGRGPVAIMAIALGAFLSFVVTPAAASQAMLQVVHNSADPAAAVVDVYVNGSRLLDDFAFRTATPFVAVPAGVELQIGVASADSDGPDDILATVPVTLRPGRRYVAIANGVLDPARFEANPQHRSIGFDLFARDGIVTSGGWGWVRLIAFHGASDAPAVDIVRRTAWGTVPLVENLGYGDFSGTRWLYPTKHVLDVTPAGDPGTVVASFDADLSGLRNGAAVVFASGFLDPDANEGGASFGLFAALPDGRVIALTAREQKARLQVIHNAADPSAAVVDVYVNGARLLDDFAFRAATPFVDVPAGVQLDIGVAPGNSAGPGDVLASFPVTLEHGKRYIAMANGVLDPSQFDSNPDGRAIGFTLLLRDGARERGAFGLVKLLAFHGATDAPAVDVVASWPRWLAGRVLVDDLAYGEFDGYLKLPARSYVLDVTPAGDNSTVVASFESDLRGLRNQAAVLFASGFLDPQANGGGPAFGLYAALPDGRVLALPGASRAVSELEGADAEASSGPALGNASPNPFNPRTTIAFALNVDGPVSLRIYDARGQLVRTLVNGPLSAGTHQVEFDGRGLASGVYYYRLDAAGFTDTRKLLLTK